MDERTRELQAARTQINSLFNGSSLGIAVTTLDGAILGVNQAMQRITGYSEDELLHTNVNELFADPEQRAQVLDQLKASGSFQDYGIRLRRRDGSIFYASLNLSGLEMAGREVLLGAIDDVSDQVKIKAALATLNDISYDMSTIADLSTLLNLAVQYLHRIVDFERATLMLKEEGGDTLAIYAYFAPDLPPAITVSHIPISRQPSIRAIMEKRETTYVPDMQAIETIQADLLTFNIKRIAAALKISRSWLSLPLLVRERTIGLLNLFHGEVNWFTANDTELARTFANQFAVAIDNIHLSEQSRLIAASDERSRIARELHDSVTQTLFTASVLAESTPRLWDSDRGIARQNMDKLSVLIRGALAEMRSLLFELRSSGIQNQTLGQLLNTMAEAVRAHSHADVAVSIKGEIALPEHVTLAFYRIAREALNNVIIHASASRVDISLLEAQDRVELRIQDDGAGFDLQALPAGHLGIGIMTERAAQIGGDLLIHSRPGQGTDLVVIWTGKDGGPEEHG